MTSNISHKSLIKLGKLYLKKIQKCDIVLAEKAATMATEIPDVIGWRASKTSILIECKTSIQDFRNDKNKWFRSADAGMGQLRYFLAPENVIPKDELPEEWGLLEVQGKKLVEVVPPGALFIDTQICTNELPLLIAYIKKLKYKLKIS